MGLLDDAIREHLELKRRRGADTGEVSRQEQEALGPARRTAEPLTPPGDDLPAAPAAREPAPPAEPLEPVERDPAPAPFADHDEWEDERAADGPLEPEAPTLSTSRPTVEFDAPDIGHAPPPPPEPFETHRPAAAPAATPPEAPRREDALADDEDDIVPADEEPEGEDLLEETPEFLEETPEHDRLWFEQRPPRDFDFGN